MFVLWRILNMYLLTLALLPSFLVLGIVWVNSASPLAAPSVKSQNFHVWSSYALPRRSTQNNTLIIIKYMQMAGIMPQTGISIRTLHRIHRNSVHKPRRIIRTDVKTCVWGKLSYCLFIQVSSPLYDIRPYDNGMKTVVSLLIRNTRFQ